MQIGDALMAWRFDPRGKRARTGGENDAMPAVAPAPAVGTAAPETGGSTGRRLADALSSLALDGATRAEKARASGRAAEREFGDWARMSPAERIRALVLEKHDLTEEALAALPEEERTAIEEEIREAIEASLGLADAGGRTPEAAPAQAAEAAS